MDIENLEKRVRALESSFEEFKQTRKLFVASQHNKSLLFRKWDKSLSRNILALFVAYVITGTFYVLAQFSTPWLRALAPIFSIATFMTTMSLVRRGWFNYHKTELGPPEKF